MEVNSESNPLERKDAEGSSLDESLENEEHLDVDSCDSDSPKNVNNDLVSPSSRVLREEDVCGVESDLVDSFEEGEIRDDSVLYNDGCIKDCMEKNLEDDAGEILGVHSQGDCGNVTTDDNEDVTPVIAPEKDFIIAPPSTTHGVGGGGLMGVKTVCARNQQTVGVPECQVEIRTNDGSQISRSRGSVSEWGFMLRISSKSGGSYRWLSLKKDTSPSTAVKNAAAAVKERSEELNVEAVMKELKSLEIADVINHEKKNKKKNKTMGTEIDNSVICKTLKVVANKLKKDAVKKDFDDFDDVIIMGKGNKKK
ncbi:hypothetical protein Tco_0763129 [Tanacetum coccineum]